MWVQFTSIYIRDRYMRTSSRRAQGQEGFTLIELLVVILIIGILAAVAIPAFLNQRGKAQDANVKSDVNTAQTAEETYYTDNQVYTPTSANLTSIEPALRSAFNAPESMALSTTAAAVGATNAGASVMYGITAHSRSGLTFGETKWSDGTVSRTCNVPAGTNSSGCKLPSGSSSGNGTW